jgi:hypothetical protein
MADNFLYIPFINPVKFYSPDRAVTPKYFTRHFDDFPFAERLYDWQEAVDFTRIWQVDDIINLQFESTFDPISVELLDNNDVPVITLPAVLGLANVYYPNTYSYEISMSLAGVATGCYRIRITAGTGDSQKMYYSKCQFISEDPIDNSILIEYYHNRFHEDVMFETGIKFQCRMLGHFGFLEPGRDEQKFKDQRYNPSVLSSRTSRGFDLFFGDDFGLPDDEVDLLNRIWGCSNVSLDGKSFGAVEPKFDFVEAAEGRYPKRGVKLKVEEGLNRYSSVFAQSIDSNKKLFYSINVEAKLFGDTSNQGSGNTVPIITIE